MTQNTRLASLLGLGGALLLTSLASAQPGRPGPPASANAPVAGPPGAGAGGVTAGGGGTVSNIDSTLTTTTTTTSGGDFGGAGDFGAADTTALPTTGGEPLIMTLLGSLTAGSALLLRRKLS